MTPDQLALVRLARIIATLEEQIGVMGRELEAKDAEIKRFTDGQTNAKPAAGRTAK